MLHVFVALCVGGGGRGRGRHYNACQRVSRASGQTLMHGDMGVAGQGGLGSRMKAMGLGLPACRQAGPHAQTGPTASPCPCARNVSTYTYVRAGPPAPMRDLAPLPLCETWPLSSSCPCLRCASGTQVLHAPWLTVLAYHATLTGGRDVYLQPKQQLVALVALPPGSAPRGVAWDLAWFPGVVVGGRCVPVCRTAVLCALHPALITPII